MKATAAKVRLTARMVHRLERARRSPPRSPLHVSARTVRPDPMHIANVNANQRGDDADDEESPTKKTPKTKKSTKKAQDSDEEEVEVKPEPNEAGELMDDMAI